MSHAIPAQLEVEDFHRVIVLGMEHDLLCIGALWDGNNRLACVIR
jgi:hypothetical protein